jgi:hypothetical protein
MEAPFRDDLHSFATRSVDLAWPDLMFSNLRKGSWAGGSRRDTLDIEGQYFHVIFV